MSINGQLGSPDLVLDVRLLLLQAVLPLHVHQLRLPPVQVVLEKTGRGQCYEKPGSVLLGKFGEHL
jgi:hypothetical protein